MKRIIHKRSWALVIISLATIITSIVIAMVVNKINPRHYYIDMQGHNSIYISIFTELIIPFICNMIPICFLNYVRRPLYILLCGVITTIMMFYADSANVSIGVISNYIVIVIFYAMLVKDLKQTRWQIILEGILHIIGFIFWIMPVFMLLTDDNFHNPIGNYIVANVIESLFLFIVALYVGLLIYKLSRFNK